MTLPNKITFARILSLPAIIVLFYSEQPKWFIVGLILGTIFALTDFLDGFLARRLGQVSTLGKILDPVADKLFVLLLLLIFVDLGLLPAWVFVLLMFREFVISDFRLLARKIGKEVAVSKVGKWKAFCQFMLTGILGLLRVFQLRFPGQTLTTAGYRTTEIVYYLFLVATILLTVISLIEYFWSNRALLLGPPKKDRVPCES